MSETGRFDIMVYLRAWVARFANWFCGPAVLFWDSPAEWEEYFSIGEPYVAEDGEPTP